MSTPTLASNSQISYCKNLSRKTKIYYNCLTDENLIVEVKNRTGFDLNNLSKDDACAIINKLNRELKTKRFGNF